MRTADSNRKKSYSTTDLVVAFSGALAAFLLYLFTMGPTITGEDSGEFVTAACTLGIPHPPGYPLFCIAGHFFSKIPYGEPAWRIGLMSAAFSAATIFLLILTVLYLVRDRTAALLAGLALACSREFWSQSVIAEVYAMNLFFLSACFLFLLFWQDQRRPRHLYFFSMFLGAGMTVHNTFLLVLPAFLAFLIWTELHRPPDLPAVPALKTYGFACLCAGAPLLVFAYLPIRSLADPMLDWGNPETLATTLRHILRVQYNFMFDQYPRNIGRFLTQLVVYIHFFREQFGIIAGLLGLLGLAILSRRRPAFGLLLTGSAVLVIGGFCFWQNFEQTREWHWVMRVFGIPAWYVVALGLGCALALPGTLARSARILPILLGVLLLPHLLIQHYRSNDKSDYYWTMDYGLNVLKTLEPEAIYVSASDHASFSLLYLQAVLGMRPDVESIRKYGYLQSALFEGLPAELKEKTGPYPPRRHDPELVAWLLRYTSRPVYLAKPMPLPGEVLERYEPCGLAFRALRPGEKAAPRDYWKEYTWRNTAADTRGDYTADAIRYEINTIKAQSVLLRPAGTDASGKERLTEATDWLEQALAAYGRDAVVLNDAGVLLARYGFYENALAYFREAVEKLPHSPEINRNLQRALNKTGEDADASEKTAP